MPVEGFGTILTHAKKGKKMREKDILSEPARVLTQKEREAFFKEGYVVKKIISDDWLQKLNEGLAKLIEKSKSIKKI